MTTDTNSIERSILINSPRARVWRALSTPEEFGQWFGVDLKGQTFAQGQRARGLMNPETCGHENLWLDIVVDRIEPQNLFSYRWHPFAVVSTVDYSLEHPTLVIFTLEDAPGNSTLLNVVESGFDQVPAHRRMEAFRMHTGGWEAQLNNVARHASQ
ncbi:MAG: vanillate O-demethylase oxidoreductase VanB [Moraxellaceae bacterium]|nr:MAG: vanillate O-demethylase oxidoreductase VanB [Moraxellaceae bacterium]